jgi:hypothetical protein
MIQIGLDHVELVEIGQQRARCGIHLEDHCRVLSGFGFGSAQPECIVSRHPRMLQVASTAQNDRPTGQDRSRQIEAAGKACQPLTWIKVAA